MFPMFLIYLLTLDVTHKDSSVVYEQVFWMHVSIFSSVTTLEQYG